MTTTLGTDVKIHTRALLVWLNLRSFSAHKFDREITQKINRDMHTATDAGRYNKHLLKDSKNLKALQTLIGTIRTEHYDRTLAWSDEGWRLLTTDNYVQYTDWVRTRQRDLGDAVDTFVAGYADDKAADRARLNGAWSSTDYPDVYDIRERFGLTLSYMPLPAEGDVRVDLAGDQVAMIERDVQSKMHESIKNAMSDAYSRLSDVVSKIAERLGDPENVFRDSLIDNARATCDALSRLNVTQDPVLDRMCDRVRRELTALDPQVLRDEKRFRRQTADRASDILAEMQKAGVI